MYIQAVRCQESTAIEHKTLIEALKALVGDAQVVTDETTTRRYRTGFRAGAGKALAVVQPCTLVEQWRVLKLCVANNKVVITQAANTGLTGGSTPAGDDYDRDVVIVNTRKIQRLHLIDEGRQVICLGGTTLHQLELALKPLGREPHSVIGSTCIGASVIGGICNNSGGSLVRRGPAYTEFALYARVDENQQVQLVNHLGIRLGENPEEILKRCEQGRFDVTDIEHDSRRCASDHDYNRRVRDLDLDVPARFNADARRLFEASGSAGRLMIFAVRLDTFAKDKQTRVFYIGSNEPAELTQIRRHILLKFAHLPVSGEYLHRDAFNLAQIYGKDTSLAIRYLGTARLQGFFCVKAWFDDRGWPTDRWLHRLSRLLPAPLPQRIKKYRDKYEHHLLLKVADLGIDETATHLRSIFPSATGDFFECKSAEADAALRHRFVTAGAAVRYRAVHRDEIGGLVSLDVALRPNDTDWFENLPTAIEEQLHYAIYYGHFFCHVFHQDYIVKKGVDVDALEHALWQMLDQRGAEYPAEHNVGHLYPAKPALSGFYRHLDPSNCLNPGLGQTSKLANWKARNSATSA